MPQPARWFLAMGAGNAALAVMLGAFGAHALKTRLPAEVLAVYQTGVHYHLFHALGLLIVGLMATQLPASGCLKWSGGLMLAGIVLFSGSLYLMSVAGWRALGVVTPFGGVAFVAAWVMFTVAILKAD